MNVDSKYLAALSSQLKSPCEIGGSQEVTKARRLLASAFHPLCVFVSSCETSFSKALLLVVISLVTVTPTMLLAQDTTAKGSPVQRTFLGAANCVMCHNNGLPKADDANAAALEVLGFTGLANDSWVMLEELKLWANQDKHSQAFTSLLNERSQQMGKLLGVAEIHRDKRCLACHTGYPLAAMGNDPHLMSAELAKNLRVVQGISCEGCHSPAGDTRGDGAVVTGWFQPHAQRDLWRFMSAKDKLDKFGFSDIRSATARTRLCLTCHLGNAAEGKVVTHEMYAAGHPPLPGFELSTFAAQMPKHWRDFDKKAEAVREEFLKKNVDDVYGRDSFKLDNLHETNNALVAALVSFSENLKLSSALADEAATMPVAKPDWPELAQFECFACHHDLKDRSWRQRRTLRGAPGRPMLRAWPTTLTKLAIKRAGHDPKEFDQRLQSIEKLLSEQPFGRRERWHATIRPLTDWLDVQALSLERKPLPRDEGLGLLREIALIAESDLWDYDSARQLVWAAQTLRRELASDRSDETLRSKVAALDPSYAEIEKLFVLDLIQGRKAQQQLPGSTKSREVQEVDLETTLPPIANYDAAVFRVLFRKLAMKFEK